MTEQNGVGRSNAPTRKDVEPTTSPTERLRELLDGRGVGWKPDDHHTTHVTVLAPNVLVVEGGEHDDMRIATNEGLAVVVTRLTPEEAVEATLGRGECRMELADMEDLRGPSFTDIYECSECGEEVMVGTVMGESEPPKWCPNCGRRVVSE